MDFTELMLQYIKPELLVLIPVLWAIGTQLKKMQKLPDWTIPLVLVIVAITFALSFVIITEGVTAVAVWAGLMQGLVIWSVEGQVYQTLKQAKERD